MICSFGNHPATNIKIEAQYSYDAEGTETMTTVELPICRSCHHENYDGTEEFPRLRKL